MIQWLLLSGLAAFQPAADSKPPVRASVKSIAANPTKYLKTAVKLTGRLENEGKNYFSDLRVVLKDAQGNRLYIRPWLPVELPPPPPGSPAHKRPTLAEFLGKDVEITAIVDRGPLRSVGEVYLLEVKSAKVVR
ncbi:MAG: hypothetical protein HYR60_09940 [Acidobacteria bacterium]|nr:hypothetical protein [Acidobacteriota bacterium]